MKLLLCTDMDRTVIPNGVQQEAENARERFSRFCDLPAVSLVYVTGRHIELMQDAMAEYHLPQADYAITDVGTRIYHYQNKKWHAIQAWENEIDQDWQSSDVLNKTKQIKTKQIYDVLEGLPGLVKQELEKQNSHKLSFYIDLKQMDEESCLKEVKQRLMPLGIQTNLIWSIDETTQTGLLDILPPKANKRHAIEFLQGYLHYADQEVVFAGDSGNDLEVLISPIQSVLVANATPELKQQAQALVEQNGTEKQFYQAINTTHDNGNYSAGVLQGVAHYLPELKSQINYLNQPIEQSITLFGEVLFDCFSQQGKEVQVLGGAPFNICWHLQALGDNPIFISRVGKDTLGETIITQAEEWGIATHNIQRDEAHSTGQVQVTFIGDEPDYDIKINSAYDFINQAETVLPHPKGILYHGSLALRSDYAKIQFQKLVDSGDWDVFLDVNLRAPWWDKESLTEWIKQAKWVKLNIDELRELGFQQTNLEEAILAFQKVFANEQVIVTQGADGVTVLTAEGFFTETPDTIEDFIDAVGAGDAFTAVYMHGLIKNWSISQTLATAQSLASKIIGIRGATPKHKSFYQSLL
ncbi:PfkB family carbohydrate kinase [Thiomicrorhabdus lithotrophica]|uniref:PfkB family carbohydrate kinase n=1 Tax=Thiomicrorhabdus lithotrophica TaxID=2949997 RepID=UPI0029623DE4|nr:PfkB family carbohydrate kinase [Thiomicrorhabdus lithotrophica]